jgi:hypothetical protein
LIVCLLRLAHVLHQSWLLPAEESGVKARNGSKKILVASLGPAVLGSLNFRRCPCVREHCHACETGERRPSYVLYGRVKGRRFTLYVPEELVPEVRRCLENGRALQELLQETAPRYINALQRQRTKTQKED